LSREKSEKRPLVLPLVVGNQPLPVFLQDRVYVDFRRQHFCGVVRLTGVLRDLSRQSIEHVIKIHKPSSISQAVSALRFVGFDPPIAMSTEDVEFIMNAGGVEGENGELSFSPQRVLQSPGLPMRLRNLASELSRDELLSDKLYTPFF
jgi:hypothetical protein